MVHPLLIMLIELKKVLRLNFSQKVSINFSNPKHVEIKNKLIGWNFLTGIFPSSIKNAVLLNLIGGIILSLIISLYDIKPGVFFFLGGMDPKKSPSQVAPHHTPDFYLDETGFVLGVKTLSNMVVDYGNMSQPIDTKSAKKGKKSK